MSKIKVIKNFLKPEEFMFLKNSIIAIGSPTVHPTFNWFLTKKLNEGNECKEYENIQFVHNFYKGCFPQSDKIHDLNAILNILNPKALIRIKANLTMRTEKQVVFGMHTDTDFNNTTGIYYLNTNNGETIFENGKRIKSEENTFVSFPSQIKHSGTTNTCDQPFRAVINFNYI